MYKTFLYCCNESQFMTKIQKDPSKQDLLDKFNNNFRYLDDVLALKKSRVSKFENEIYPKRTYLI